ncbi:hypothetical protein F4861DRAFT_536419 [Xylaria intraflava]|nr:hypothetical protein F4861DRAFT_536419 [Xylaria intraflava]
MEALRQSIAEIDSAIIEARQWLKEAKTDEDAKDRRTQLGKLEADLVVQQAKLNARVVEEQAKKR